MAVVRVALTKAGFTRKAPVDRRDDVGALVNERDVRQFAHRDVRVMAMAVRTAGVSIVAPWRVANTICSVSPEAAGRTDFSRLSASVDGVPGKGEVVGVVAAHGAAHRDSDHQSDQPKDHHATSVRDAPCGQSFHGTRTPRGRWTHNFRDWCAPPRANGRRSSHDGGTTTAPHRERHRD